MTETKNLEGVRVGDTVYDILDGNKGEVQKILIERDLPLGVRWDGGITTYYTIDGRCWNNDIFPLVVFAPPKVEYAPRPKNMVKKKVVIPGVDWIQSGGLTVPRASIMNCRLLWTDFLDKPPMTMTLEWEEEEE